MLASGWMFFRRGGEWPRFRTLTPFELVGAEAPASEIHRHFPTIIDLKSGRAERRRLSATAHRPSEIAGPPRRLRGPFGGTQADKGDFITPFLYAPGGRGIGPMETVRTIGD